MSNEECAGVVAQWTASGMTARELRSAHGCEAGSLYQWASESRRSAVPQGLVEVCRVRDDGASERVASGTSVVEVVLASGRIVRVQGDLDPDLLIGVVQTLEAMC